MLESDGVAIWQMAVTPPKSDEINAEANSDHVGNGYVSKFNGIEDHDNSESDEDSDSPGPLNHSDIENPRVAIGYDDGSARIYAISDTDEFIYVKSLPRVKGERFSSS